MKQIKKLWKNYKYRFTPWLALNLAQKAKLPSDNQNVAMKQIEKDLYFLLESFKSPPYTCLFRGNTSERRQIFKSCHDQNQEILQNSWNFQLDIKSSNIKDGGRGVFVKKGKIKKGQTTTLYPGLVYKPYHPVLLASISNSYIFRCSDGSMLDGKTKGDYNLRTVLFHARERVNIQSLPFVIHIWHWFFTFLQNCIELLIYVMLLLSYHSRAV